MAHSGDRADGEFGPTLNVTLIHTTWVESGALLGKSLQECGIDRREPRHSRNPSRAPRVNEAGDRLKPVASRAAWIWENDRTDNEVPTRDEFTVKVYADTAVVWFTRVLVGPNC